ncbi:hypothetical protein LUW74_21915 [Actinomadura madurae]|nr:hypothetical protein [Actinomadura madurae]URN05706.1 hypothetical protein LUW74_21915 [Actinomadura madurae]
MEQLLEFGRLVAEAWPAPSSQDIGQGLPAVFSMDAHARPAGAITTA